MRDKETPADDAKAGKKPEDTPPLRGGDDQAMISSPFEPAQPIFHHLKDVRGPMMGLPIEPPSLHRSIVPQSQRASKGKDAAMMASRFEPHQIIESRLSDSRGIITRASTSRRSRRTRLLFITLALLVLAIVGGVLLRRLVAPS